MFQQLLKDAHSRGIIVTSIVIDNLPAQLSGARNAVTTIEEPFNATSVIPCFCHLVNLIFLGAVHTHTAYLHFVSICTSLRSVCVLSSLAFASN